MNKITLSVFLLFFFFHSVAQHKISWQNSRGNAQLTGVTSAGFPEEIELKWTFRAGGMFKSAPVISDGKIVVGSTNGTLYCLNLKGDSLWGFKTGNAFEAPALISNGIVYIGNLTGMFYALNLKNGKKIWQYKTDNQIMGAPAIITSGGRETLAVGSYDYYLHGIDAQTGNGLWKYESDNFLNSAPSVWGNNAVFGGCDGFLHIVDMGTGETSGKIEVATYVASSPAVVDETAYIGDYDGGFNCIDLKNKKIRWRYQNTKNDLPFIASPSVIGDKIFIGSRDKFMYCFNRESGEIIWEKNTGSRIDASTVVNKKHVLLVNMRGDLMLLDSETGKTLWNYELGIGIMNTPAVIDNTIIVAGSDGSIYCFASPNPSKGGE
ncbi:MAG: PQQ-binding-like beta-propeller repeat protein [Prolixibacteraceae bacterium]|nr:PQQ-binding-like beta-propeller repeat protein [Prolixibacteraceae bacterium]